jgi:hypothetical protein
MTKAVVLTQGDWAKIHNQIARDYPPSVLLIRDKMKSVLGFTSRSHQEWFDHDVSDDRRNVGYNTKYCVETIHLDFYNEPKRTMFLLKYGDFIREKPSYSETE